MIYVTQAGVLNILYITSVCRQIILSDSLMLGELNSLKR